MSQNFHATSVHDSLIAYRLRSLPDFHQPHTHLPTNSPSNLAYNSTSMSHQSPQGSPVILSPSPFRSPAHKKHKPNAIAQSINSAPSDKIVTIVPNVSASEQEQIKRIVKIVKGDQSSGDTITFTKEQFQALLKSGAIFGDSNVEVESKTEVVDEHESKIDDVGSIHSEPHIVGVNNSGVNQNKQKERASPAPDFVDTPPQERAKFENFQLDDFNPQHDLVRSLSLNLRAKTDQLKEARDKAYYLQRANVENQEMKVVIEKLKQEIRALRAALKAKNVVVQRPKPQHDHTHKQKMEHMRTIVEPHVNGLNTPINAVIVTGAKVDRSQIVEWITPKAGYAKSVAYPPITPKTINSELTRMSRTSVLNVTRLKDYVEVCLSYFILIILLLCVLVYITLCLFSHSVNKLLHMVDQEKLNISTNIVDIQIQTPTHTPSNSSLSIESGNGSGKDFLKSQNNKFNFRNILKNEKNNLKLKNNLKFESEVENEVLIFNSDIFMNMVTQFEPIFHFSKYNLCNKFLFSIAFLFISLSIICKNCIKFEYDIFIKFISSFFMTFTTVFSSLSMNLLSFLFILTQYNLLLYTFSLPNFYDTIYYPYQSSVSYFNQSYSSGHLQYVPDPTFNATCYTSRPRVTSLTRDSSGLQFITEYVKDDKNKYRKLNCMMDTGATICGINAELARRHFSKQIQKLARPLPIETIDTGGTTCQHFIDFEIYNPSNNKIKTSARFYLMPSLSFDCLASTHFLKSLGWRLVQVHPTFEHPRQPDETFGTCNNWDNDDISVSFDYNKKDNIAYEKEYLKYLTPWQEYVYKCINPQVEGTPLESVTSIYTGTQRVNMNNKHVHHISRYKVSRAELKKAKQLCKDRHFKGVPLEHLKLRSKWLYNKMYHLCYVKYKDCFAKHQFDLGKIKNFEFKIDLKDESKGERIFVPQYHLDGDKRLVVLYNSIKNIKNGLYEPSDNTFHNVPILVVLKKDGRYRLAYDFRLLNKHTKDVKSHIPSYNWLFELLQGRGLFTISDAKNFFEAIVTRACDRLYSTIHAPNGRFVLTRGTYGYKNIATYAQQVSDHLMLPLGRAGAFIDDMFIKHPENATDQELVEIAEKFLLRCRKLGVLLHPEKTYFFVPEVEFLGYIFNQKGHRPRPEYIQRILEIDKPVGVSQIRAFLGLIQYIARYVHRLARWSHYLTLLTLKDGQRTWGKLQEQAYNEIIEKVKNIGLLYHPTDDGVFLVQTDASLHSIAGTLFQLQYDPEVGRKQWKLIEFFSKQLDRHLLRHHIGVKECLAISYSLNHWKHFLLRDKFYLDTDHKNLIRLYDPDYDSASNMKKQQIFKTMQDATAMFHFELAHLEGKELILADYLSRDGSKPNCIDNNLIKLNKTIQFADNVEASMYKINYLKMLDHRDNIFSDVHNDWKPISEMDPILQHAYTIHETDFKTRNKSVNNKFDIDHLNHEYIKNHGYFSKPITSDTVYTSSVQLQLRNHNRKERVNKYNTNGLKSILRNNCTYNSIDSTQDRQLIDSIYDNNYDKFESLLTKRLSVSFTNTLTNMLDYENGVVSFVNNEQVIGSLNKQHFEYLNNLFNSYCLKSNNSISHDSIYMLNNSPNYSMNHEYKRRSTRKRSQNLPFWKRNNKQNKIRKPKIVSKNKNVSVKNKNKLQLPNNNNNNQSSSQLNCDLDDSKDDCKEDKIDNKNKNVDKIDNNDENEYIQDNDDYTYELLKDTHTLKFPYSTTVDVIDNLYQRLFKPEIYNEKLSNENFEFEQNEDKICSIIKNHIINCMSASDVDYVQSHCPTLVHLIINDCFIIKDNLLYIKADKNHSRMRLFVPSALIHTLMSYEHCINHLGHPGVSALSRILNSKYYWPHLHSDVEIYVQQCVPCQLGKGSKSYKRGKLAPLLARVFNQIVHMDFAGPFYGTFYILIIVDKFSGYTMLLPCRSTSAEVVVHSLLYNWYPFLGMPRKIYTDRGNGFIAEANQIVCDKLGIKKLFTSSYHPQTNSKAERIVQETKKALRMVNIELDDALTSKSFDKNPVDINYCIKQITLLLPSIQFSINQKVHNMTLVSPHMMLFGKNLNDIVDLKLARELHDNLPSDFDKLSTYEIRRQIQLLIAQTHERYHDKYDKYVIIMKDNYDLDKYNDYFKIGDLVAYYIGDRSATNKKLRKRFTGPWKIISRLRHNTVRIKNLIDGKEIATHVGMLKKYYAKGFTPLIEIEKSERAKLLAQIRASKSNK